ncbi:protein FAM228B-like isoform X2 [Babylonia areolata]|uniref:protein FAM228B-like isoform X2 n=2 Tax=Babylonia areolata TaxID=304850 RepID=UPI003FD05708
MSDLHDVLTMSDLHDFMPRHRNQLHHKVKKRGVHSSISSSLSSDDAVRSGTASKTTNSTPVTDNTDMMDFDNKEKEPLNNLCAPLLDMENTFVKDVDQYLGRVDMLALRKREMLHKTWNSRVFEPLRRKVLQAVYSSDYKETERRHRELYRQYLEYTNKKGFVFLDTMDKGEYYAQALNGHRPAPITVRAPPLQDPLLQQGRERSREEQTILRCTTGQVYSLSDIDQIRLPPLPLVPLGRHSATCHTWLAMPLGNIESTPRRASRLRMKGTCTQSQIDLSHRPTATFDPGTIDREMKSQKKRMFVNTPPFDRPPRPVLKPPFACCNSSSGSGGVGGGGGGGGGDEASTMCPVSA